MIGKRYKYTAHRTGECIDVSFCGKWLLLLRDDVKKNEQDKVAVALIDHQLKEINYG